jgi:hypothetical protein
MRIKITFLRGLIAIARIDAIRDLDRDNLTVADMELIPETEQLLEKLTGLRVHIEQEE